jgi:hypothetical protein
MAGCSIRIDLKSTQDIEDPFSPGKSSALPSGLDTSTVRCILKLYDAVIYEGYLHPRVLQMC